MLLAWVTSPSLGQPRTDDHGSNVEIIALENLLVAAATPVVSALVLGGRALPLGAVTAE